MKKLKKLITKENLNMLANAGLIALGTAAISDYLGAAWTDVFSANEKKLMVLLPILLRFLAAMTKPKAKDDAPAQP